MRSRSQAPIFRFVCLATEQNAEKGQRRLEKSVSHCRIPYNVSECKTKNNQANINTNTHTHIGVSFTRSRGGKNRRRKQKIIYHKTRIKKTPRQTLRKKWQFAIRYTIVENGHKIQQHNIRRSSNKCAYIHPGNTLYLQLIKQRKNKRECKNQTENSFTKVKEVTKRKKKRSKISHARRTHTSTYVSSSTKYEIRCRTKSSYKQNRINHITRRKITVKKIV